MPPGTYRNITGNTALAYGLVAAGAAVRAAGVPRRLPDHPGVATSCTSCRKHKRFGVTHVPGRGRDRRRRRRARRGVRRRARRDDHVRPGRRAEGGGDRPGGDARAAAGHRRRAARRAVHRAADQDRAGRPAAGDVRPQRRGAGAGDRAAQSPADCFDAAIEAARIAIDLPDAGVPAVRRLPGQRRPSRGCCPDARTSCRSSTSAASRRQPNDGDDFLPYLRDPETLARPWAIPGTPGWSTGSAASRRPTGPGRSPTTRPTTTSWSAPGRPRWTGSPVPPAARGR